MRWDDLELLQLIDELEQRGAYISNGMRLWEDLSSTKNLPRDEQSARNFARELRLAGDAGYITWTKYDRFITGAADPDNNAWFWLQDIGDLRLTLAGRDRGRGRVIVTAPPDPDEDDGRLITGETLHKIALTIAESYTTRVRRYLIDSGIPADKLPETGQTMSATSLMAYLKTPNHDAPCARLSVAG